MLEQKVGSWNCKDGSGRSLGKEYHEAMPSKDKGGITNY